MVALLVLAVFALCFIVVIAVIAAGRHWSAPPPKPAEQYPAGMDEDTPAPPVATDAIAFDWLTPVNAPGLLNEESLSTISVWDSLLARFDGIEIMKHHLAQSVRGGIAGGKALPVDLAQRADQRGAVLVADFAILIALAIVKTWLAHAALPCADGRNILPPG